MTQPHRYGPHRAEDAPNAVTVLSGGTSTGTPVRTEVVPMPPQLTRQRAQLNQLAHFAALLATVAEPCHHDWRSHPDWPARYCRLCGVRSDG